MILWLDAQLPPSAAAWLTATFGIEARAVRDLGLRDAKDAPIFQAARAAEAVMMTKGQRLRRDVAATRAATEGTLGDLRQYFQCPTP